MADQKKENTNKNMNKSEDVESNENLQIRSYLDQTVMPLLLQGLLETSKEKPRDPIEFLGKYLLQHSNEK